MKFFLDTANLYELKKGADTGLDQFLKDRAKVFHETPTPVAGDRARSCGSR